MPEPAAKIDLSPLPTYDWEHARKMLVFYFSRRRSMDAEGLAQETLTRLVAWLRKGHTIEGKDGFMKMVYGVAGLVHLEDVKRGRRTTDELSEDAPAPANTTWGLNTQEACELLREILQHLPERERQLVLAAEGMAQDDLAEKMGISISALRVLLHRARAKLRAIEVAGWNLPEKE